MGTIPRGESDSKSLFLAALHDNKIARLIFYSKDDHRQIIRTYGLDKTHITGFIQIRFDTWMYIVQKGKIWLKNFPYHPVGSSC